jgi:dTDP-4-dehydrorhamnose 3,5-epimerase
MEDIQIKELKVHQDGDEGHLYEGLRDDDKLFDGKFGQTLISVVNPGIKKGLHKHEKQIDYTLCIKGRLLYVAVNSETKEVKTFELGEKNPIMLKVPIGWWHGYMPLDNKEAVILHVMDKAYDNNDPDTQELDVNAFGDIWKL